MWEEEAQSSHEDSILLRMFVTATEVIQTLIGCMWRIQEKRAGENSHLSQNQNWSCAMSWSKVKLSSSGPGPGPRSGPVPDQVQGQGNSYLIHLRFEASAQKGVVGGLWTLQDVKRADRWPWAWKNVSGTTTWARIFIQLYMPNAANWRRKKWVEFSPFNVGYQVKLRELQTKLGVKKDTILKSLEKESHEYFAFFVCRNPIEKLKSLYSYSLDLNRFKRGETPQSFRDFIVQVFRTNSTFSFNSLYSLCAPCSRHYDAIINMETFSRDSRDILRHKEN